MRARVYVCDSAWQEKKKKKKKIKKKKKKKEKKKKRKLSCRHLACQRPKYNTKYNKF
jgi:hypothetical protein